MNLEKLDHWVQSNPFLSAIVLGIAGNLLTSLFKNILHIALTNLKPYPTWFGRSILKWSYKNIEFIVRHYENEIKEVETLTCNSENLLLQLVKSLYQSSRIIIVVIVLSFVWLFFLRELNNDVLSVSFFVVLSVIFFRWFFQVRYILGLFAKTRSFDQYKAKTLKKINAFKRLL